MGFGSALNIETLVAAAERRDTSMEVFSSLSRIFFVRTNCFRPLIICWVHFEIPHYMCVVYDNITCMYLLHAVSCIKYSGQDTIYDQQYVILKY